MGLLVTIGLIVVFAIIVILFEHPSKETKEKAEELLESLKKDIKLEIMDFINHYPIISYEEYDDFLADMLNELYLDIENYVKEMIKSNFPDKKKTNMIFNIISERVRTICTEVFYSAEVQEKIAEAFSSTVGSIIDNMLKEEEEAAKLAEAYENETIDVDPFEEEDEIEHEEFEYPDYESKYDPDDETMEEISNNEK